MQEAPSEKNSKAAQTHHSKLPPIPEKRYFTIGEVSELCAVKPHVLRYWEQEFKQLRPMKRRGNRRYYQKQDVLLIRQIRTLLYEQGYTIQGARLQLKTERSVQPEADKPLLIQHLIGELEKIRAELLSAD